MAEKEKMEEKIEEIDYEETFILVPSIRGIYHDSKPQDFETVTRKDIFNIFLANDSVERISKASIDLNNGLCNFGQSWHLIEGKSEWCVWIAYSLKEFNKVVADKIIAAEKRIAKKAESERALAEAKKNFLIGKIDVPKVQEKTEDQEAERQEKRIRLKVGESLFGKIASVEPDMVFVEEARVRWSKFDENWGFLKRERKKHGMTVRHQIVSLFLYAKALKEIAKRRKTKVDRQKTYINELQDNNEELRNRLNALIEAIVEYRRVDSKTQMVQIERNKVIEHMDSQLIDNESFLQFQETN